jgi:hypothetical protein
MFENINFAPLPGSLMAIGILGFLLTVVYREVLSLSWSFTLGLFFIILFIASFLSLHYGPLPTKENF